ncbi:hypothetical protein TcasGA2_TC000259 [Tribolium castaneum]|uniref:Uncharacterized protein n=1 Tax=Tribolium castaneum TaxID=7070 RepID=D6WBQ4_TRICA|nr:hypothetical protein TcasGA2_TC000259 [Tribolium castaneum]
MVRFAARIHNYSSGGMAVFPEDTLRTWRPVLSLCEPPSGPADVWEIDRDRTDKSYRVYIDKWIIIFEAFRPNFVYLTRFRDERRKKLELIRSKIATRKNKDFTTQAEHFNAFSLVW